MRTMPSRRDVDKLSPLTGVLTEASLGFSPTIASFGSSVAIGDLTGDGRPELVIGAQHDASGRDAYGRLFVLQGTASGPQLTNPTTIDAITVSNLMVSAGSLGSELAIGDVNGDGFGDIVAGASDAGVDGRIQAGAVIAFYGSASGVSAARRTTVHEHTTGVPGEPDSAEAFGASVSVGDVTGDGYADLAVGTPNESRPNPNHRRVRPMAHAGYYFGQALAIGNVTGDGFADLAVGVPGMGEGTIELFAGSQSGIRYAPASRVSGHDLDGNGQTNFAQVMSIADTNADGRGDLLVGAPTTYNGLLPSGAIVEFRGLPTGLSAVNRRVLKAGAGGFPAVGSQGNVGSSFATGDVNGDGYADLVTGTPYANPHNEPYPWPGMVILLFGSANGLTQPGPSR
jgi:hypothetical protein